MRLFLDTEFTDFIDCELISIGIASEDGHEFYAERNDFDLSKCSHFVKEAILPLLGRESPIVGTEEEIGTALRAWLTQFKEVEICVDYSTDFELFGYLVRDPDTLALPAHIKGCNIRNIIDAADIERYWQENGRMAHHALHDARANRYAFECHVSAQTLRALVSCKDTGFIAKISNGKVMHADNPEALAKLLFKEGVPDEEVHCSDWREGDASPSVGQVIALKSELQRLKKLSAWDSAISNIGLP